MAEDSPKAKTNDVAGYRKELDELFRKEADAMRPLNPENPKDLRKVGPPLTDDEARRLWELHYLANARPIPKA